MITYGSTTLTSYNTITKIEVYYYKSTSSTDLAGGSWSTTKPTWENGKYIWQKIRTTYEGKLANGQFYSESDPVNITGQQGATGSAAYSYKLNASDTAVTVSKTGEYSVNKITFTATYKQGTGAVTAYAGRFKIETTLNGTTWTTVYTSSGNESSKQYTLPENIISIRCSLYQAGGTSILLDTITIPIVNDDRPLVTKTYTGLIGSANDAANASFYFAKIHPDSYTTNYKVKMKVRVTAPEAYAETIDIQFGGYGSTFSSFDAYTTRTGSVGVYYINLYRATQAGISTNHKGHALGIGLRSSTNPTSTSYKRTIIVDILELDGCTVEILDTAVKYANIDGTGSTNYYGLTEMAVGTAGQNATNNINTHYTQYSNNVKAGTNGIKGYTLIMKDSENTWSCFYSGAYKVANTGKPVYTGGFMLGKILYSAGAGAQTSDSSLDTYYNYKSGVNTSTVYDAYPVDLRYSTNCASTLTSQRPVYIVGTIENDGLFHLDVSQWWTQTEPTYADGKVYIYVGMAYSSYQVWLSTENPAYMFYNGEFILYDKAQTLQNINTLKNSLETQIDSKVETWCQKTNPASSWDATERPNHTGDLWYYTGESDNTYKNNTTYQYNGSTNTWSAYSANPDLFDKIDGKTAIYYGTTSSVTSAEEGDYLVDSTDGSSYRWDGSKWVKLTDYKAAIDAIEIGGRNLLCNSNQSLTTVSSKGEFYLSETIPTDTTIVVSVQIDADDITWASSGNRRMGFEMSQATDGVASGTQYAGIWWTYPKTTFHGRIWSKVKLTRDFPATIKRFGLYVQGVTGGTYKVSKPKVEIATKPTDWTPAPEDTQADIDTALAQSVEYIVGTQTATTGTWTGKTVDKELKVGKTIAYKLPYSGSGNASLVLTLADNTTTNAIAVYLNTTRVTTHFGAGSVINMTYDGQYWRASSIPNSNTVGVYGGAFTAGTNGVRGYSLIMKDTQNTWVSITTSAGSNSTNAGNGTNHAKYAGGLYFDTVMYEESNANYASGASIGTCYTALAIDLRYSTNCGSTLIKGRDVYLVGTITNGLFYLDNTWWTQTLPTSQNDKVYIYLGSAYSTTSIYLVENNPAYMYYEGKFLTLKEIETEKAKKTATNYMSSDNTGIMVADLTDGEQLPANATGKNVFITAGYGSGDVAVNAGVHIRNGQEDLAFFGETAQIGKSDQGHIILDNDSVDIKNDNNVLASFGATSVIGDENDWHQTIAANQITFAKGNDIITYISPDKLYTINAEVADAFYISNYSIRNASDGKLVIGLRR